MRRAPAGADPPARARIDARAIAGNTRAIREATRRDVLAVVKADGYGHGMETAARAALRGGARALCVATVDEAARLRRTFGAAELLLLNPALPSEAPRILSLRLVPAAGDLAFARAYARAAGRRGADAHLNFDTGIGRDGFRTQEASAFVRDRSLRRLRIRGVMTHLCRGAGPRDGVTPVQLDRFRSALARLGARLLPGGIRHAASSAAILTSRDAYFDAVRPGLLLYGIEPRRASVPRPPRVRPAMALDASVTALRVLEAGDTVGYGPAWRARRRTRVATVAIGYADGLPRAYAARGEILLAGRRARILGTVNMDVITVDASRAGALRVGDRAVLFGASGRERIDAAEVARRCGTIPYEILSRVGPRVVREAA